MSITKTKTWVAGAVVVALLLSVAGWFLLIAPKRASAAQLRDQAVAASASNAQLELRIAELKAEFAELPQRQAELAVVKKALPEQAELPSLVRDLDSLAEASGVTLMSLVPSPVVPVVSAAAVAPPASDTSAESTGAEGAAPAPPVADSLLSVPMSVEIVGNFFNAEVFLRGLQTEFGRDFLVTGLSVVAQTEAEAANGKPAVKNGDVTMTITGSVFILQSVAGSAAVDSGQTPNAPADAATTN